MACSSVTVVVLVLVLAAFTASCGAVLPVNPYVTVQIDSVDDSVDVDAKTATVVAADAADDDVEAGPASGRDGDDEKLKAVKRTEALLEQVVARNKVRARVRAMAWRRKSINMGMGGEKDLNDCINAVTNVISSIEKLLISGDPSNILGQISAWISSVTNQCSSPFGGAAPGSGSPDGPAAGAASPTMEGATPGSGSAEGPAAGAPSPPLDGAAPGSGPAEGPAEGAASPTLDGIAPGSGSAEGPAAGASSPGNANAAEEKNEEEDNDKDDKDKAAVKKDINTVVAALHSLLRELNIPSHPTFVNQLHY